MVKRFLLGDRSVGDGAPCFLIAEAGVNHNGDPRLAERLIQAARDGGADAVKFQSFRAEDLATPGAAKAGYQKRGKRDRETQRGMLRSLEMAGDDLEHLAEYAREQGLIFLSSPFDAGSADSLERIGVPAYKVASGELTNTPLLRHIARKGKPVILSTGMAGMGEIEEAIRVIRGEGVTDLILLHCVTRYPAPLSGVNFRVIPTLRTAFDLPVGFSDHTLGITAPLVALALGACVIEKHLTLDRDLPGPDHRASLEPGEFGEMTRLLREVEEGLGTGVKVIGKEEREMRAAARRSLVAARDIPRGTTLGPGMIAAKRPGIGIPPAYLDSFLGRKSRVAIPKDTLLTWDMVA